MRYTVTMRLITRLTAAQVDELVRRYTNPLEDGTWVGATTLARDYGVTTTTIYNHLSRRGVETRNARDAHSGGKRCKPIKNLPTGTAPSCKCGCGSLAEWNQRKNGWNVYMAGHYRRDAPYKDRDWLHERYVVDRLTVHEIAAECGVNHSSILRYMRRHEIPARDKSEARMGRKVGELNPAWKGGVAKWPYSSDWKVIARRVRDRDDWTCQDCGERRARWGNGLHVHHIDEDKFNNNPENLVSLCAACHYKRHSAEPLATCPPALAS